MKILITDFHVGCQLWQYRALKKLDHDVEIYSLSGHSRYLDQMRIPYKKIDKFYYEKNINDLLRFDVFVISFWPSHLIHPFNFVEFCEKYKKRIILNCGHRFNIRTPKDLHIQMLDALSFLQNDSKHTLAVMSDYDFHYIKHYTGIAPKKLLVYSHHLSFKKMGFSWRLAELKSRMFNLATRIVNFREAAKANSKNTVLIGPAHNRKIIHPFESVQELNDLSRKHSLFKRADCIRFDFIKNLFSNYKYSDLVKFKACIIYPYSVFSISTVELYNLNIPILVPSIEILIEYNVCIDRSLFPIYCSEEKYKLLEYKQENFTYSFSPNSYKKEDVAFWLKYIYLYNKKNTIIFTSKEDLIHKIYTLNFDNIRAEMKKENEMERISSLADWEKCLAS